MASLEATAKNNTNSKFQLFKILDQISEQKQLHKQQHETQSKTKRQLAEIVLQQKTLSKELDRIESDIKERTPQEGGVDAIDKKISDKLRVISSGMGQLSRYTKSCLEKDIKDLRERKKKLILRKANRFDEDEQRAIDKLLHLKSKKTNRYNKICADGEGKREKLRSSEAAERNALKALKQLEKEEQRIRSKIKQEQSNEYDTRHKHRRKQLDSSTMPNHKAKFRRDKPDPDPRPDPKPDPQPYPAHDPQPDHNPNPNHTLVERDDRKHDEPPVAPLSPIHHTPNGLVSHKKGPSWSDVTKVPQSPPRHVNSNSSQNRSISDQTTSRDVGTVSRGPRLARQHRVSARHSPQSASHSPQSARHSPQSARHRPQSARHRPQSAGHSPHSAHYSPTSSRHSSELTQNHYRDYPPRLLHHEEFDNTSQSTIASYANMTAKSNPPSHSNETHIARKRTNKRGRQRRKRKSGRRPRPEFIQIEGQPDMGGQMAQMIAQLGEDEQLEARNLVIQINAMRHEIGGLKAQLDSPVRQDKIIGVQRWFGAKENELENKHEKTVKVLKGQAEMLQREINSRSDGLLCKKCQKRDIDSCVRECGHCFCEICAMSMGKGGQCYVCRNKIEEVVVFKEGEGSSQC